MKRIAILAAALIGCGGGGKTAISHNNQGVGSSTLTVTANIDAVTSNGNPLTTFTVTVKDGSNANVSGATVTISNQDIGALAIPETTTQGRYQTTKPQFLNGDISLSVVKGTDSVDGVRLGNPGMSTINAPLANSTVPANTALDVSWTTPMMAQAASISTLPNYNIVGPDDGAFTIPAANNPARNPQTLTLVRSNEVQIAGGLPGSKMKVTSTTVLTPYTVQ